MLYHTHSGVCHYEQAFGLTHAIPAEQQCHICFDPGCDRHLYQASNASVREIDFAR